MSEYRCSTCGMESPAGSHIHHMRRGWFGRLLWWLYAQWDYAVYRWNSRRAGGDQ